MTDTETTGNVNINNDPVISVHVKSSEAAFVTEVSDFLFTFSTWSIGTQAIQIAQADPDRETILVLPIDGPIVLAQSYALASNPANVVAGVPNPQGAYIPTGVGVSLDGTDDFWAVAPGTTRVTVISTRRR